MFKDKSLESRNMHTPNCTPFGAQFGLGISRLYVNNFATHPEAFCLDFLHSNSRRSLALDPDDARLAKSGHNLSLGGKDLKGPGKAWKIYLTCCPFLLQLSVGQSSAVSTSFILISFSREAKVGSLQCSPTHGSIQPIPHTP